MSPLLEVFCHHPLYNCVLSVTSLLFTVLNISSVSLYKEQQMVAFLCSSITKCVVKMFCKLIVLLLARERSVIKRAMLQLVEVIVCVFNVA